MHPTILDSIERKSACLKAYEFHARGSALAHIPKFEDTSRLPREMTRSPAGYAASPAGDVGASPNFGICDTTQISTLILQHSF